jgi:hypothetical protein
MPSRDIRRAQKKKGEAYSETVEKRRTTHPLMYAGLVVLLVVIVVTFVLAGPGGPLGRGGGGASGSLVFGSYQGREIAYYQGSYFAQERDRIASQVAKSSTSQADTEAMTQSIWYQAFLSTAEHMAILAQVEQAGGVVTEDAVDKALLGHGAYLDEDGKFSETRYRATAASERANTRSITRESLLSGIFVTDVLYGVKDGARETEFLKSMALPERSFQFVSWPFSSFPADAVRAFGEANTSRFQRIKLSRILVKSSESQASEILKKIEEKTSTFEELARTYSKDTYADKGGDMGWRYAYDVEADFDARETAQKVLTLKAGELSQVLKGTFGWLIYRCDSEAVPADFTNETVQQDVKTYITTYEKGKIEDYFNERAGQLSRRAAEAGFDRAVKEMGLKAVATEYFPVNLSGIFSFAPVKANPDTETPTNAAYSEDFFFRAFSLGKDQVSAPIILDDRILVLKLAGERQLPESTASLLGNYVSYLASQSVQTDLAQALLTTDRLKDDFAATFSKYFAPAGSKQ